MITTFVVVIKGAIFNTATPQHVKGLVSEETEYLGIKECKTRHLFTFGF